MRIYDNVYKILRVMFFGYVLIIIVGGIGK